MKTLQLIIAIFGFTTVTMAQQTIKMVVKENTVPCVGVVPAECLQVKEGKAKDWSFFYDHIEGFTYEPGFQYELKVVKTKVKGTIPADASAYKYKLKKIVKKKKIKTPVVESSFLDKKLVLTKIDGKEVKNGNVYFVMNAAEKAIYGKSGVNRFNSMFELKGNKVSIKPGMGTLMAGTSEDMELERVFLDKMNTSYNVYQKGNVVEFKDDKNKVIMEFTIPSVSDVWSFIDGKKFKLYMLDNTGMDYGDAFIQFNVAEKKVNGNSGCNNFFGSFDYSSDHISFSQMGSTKKGCLSETANETEQKVLNYLRDSKLRYDVAEQTLNFYNGDRLVMMFGVIK